MAVGVAEATLEEIVLTTGHRFIKQYAPKLIMARDAKHMLWQLREQDMKLGLISNHCEPLDWLTIEPGSIEHFGFILAAWRISRRQPA